MDDYIQTASTGEEVAVPSVNYVAMRLETITSDLKNLALYINGNIPNIAAGPLAQAILLIDSFVSKIKTKPLTDDLE